MRCPGDFDMNEVLAGSRPLNRFLWSGLSQFAHLSITDNEPRPEGAVKHCYRYYRETLLGVELELLKSGSELSFVRIERL